MMTLFPALRRLPLVLLGVALCASLWAVAPVPVRAAATLTVATAADTATTDGQCSLRGAVTNGRSALRHHVGRRGGQRAGDTIAIAATGKITLTSALPALAKDVTIAGPTSGAGVIVDGGCTVNGSGVCTGGGVTVFTVSSGVTATISTLTIQHGGGQVAASTIRAR